MFKKYFYTFLSFLAIIISLFSFLNIKASNLLSFPIRSYYKVTSIYGYRFLSSYHFHNGIDLGAKINTPVYALYQGTVTYIGFSSSFGNTVIISYNNGYKSLYGHLDSKFNVKIGYAVNSSTVIGYIGPKYLSNGKLNGMTTGPHLHFTLYYNGKIIDPNSISFKK